MYVKKLIAAVVLAAVAPLAFTAPAQARATATTFVTWGGGGTCIQHQGAMIANPYLLSAPTWSCSDARLLQWDEVRYAGQWIGVDPIMGDADWIACTINDGWRTYRDYADAGDGTDVNCLRVAN